MDLYFNKQLISTLYKTNRHEAEFNYRYYLIAKLHFYKRSGIFSLNELMDILHAHYDHKTLHHNPGNNRTKFRKRLQVSFDASMLFERLQDGRYKAKTEKRYFRYSQRIKTPLEALKSKRAFIDALVCVLMAGNGFKSYNQAAEQTGYTASRIQYAVRRGSAAGFLEKTNNLVITDVSSADKREVEQARRFFARIHGIFTPGPLRYKGQYHLCFYAPNSYSIVDRGHKGASGHLTYITKQCRYKIIDRMNQINVMLFNKNYSMSQYIGDYGFLNI